MKNPQEEPKKETQYLDEMPNVDKKLLAKMWEDTIPRVDPKRGVFLMNAHGVIDTREPKQELELKDFESSSILDVLNMGNVKYLDNGDIIYNPNLLFIKRDDKWFIKTELPKQETLEEAAENYGWRIKTNTFSDPVKANELAQSAKQDFMEGVKWYREQLKQRQ